MTHPTCRVRTVTVFVTLPRDEALWQPLLQRANAQCNAVARALYAAGYETQSLRVVTNPFGEYLDVNSTTAAQAGMATLAGLLDGLNGDLRLRFGIGEARTPEEVALLPGLIAAFGDLANACVNFDTPEALHAHSALLDAAADAVLEIAKKTPRGEGNFNFTVNFNCPPLIPYFPAGYHRESSGQSYVIGLETPDLLAAALQNLDAGLSFTQRLHTGAARMRTALQGCVDEILAALDGIDTDWTFQGIDSSAAPSKDCTSMVEVYRALGVPHFGASGTLAASSALTSVFQSIEGVPLVGFSGLMLALTEDQGLADASKTGTLDLTTLLANSAVCGIGLDTVPLPGDVNAAQLKRLFEDTATLAFRLNKPLTVRVFPVPGKRAGDMTVFESDDLCNCVVQAVS